MRIIYIIQKEFKQIFRNKMMIPIIFAMPLIQLLVLSYTATFEIKYADLSIIDLDKSTHSRELISHFSGSPFFRVIDEYPNVQQSQNAMNVGKIEAILVIPQEFSNDILKGNSPSLRIITDAVNGNAASVITAYIQNIVFNYNKSLILDFKSIGIGVQSPYSFWYNPHLNYITYMVPGILVLLITMIGTFLSGMNIVKEKEIGTIEQLNVTPISKTEFIIGKLLPFWFIAMFDLCFGLLVAKLAFSIPIVGSIWLIIGVASIYLLVVLGIGLFISTITNTQQQAMFLAWFFMVIFILMSGLFTPIESMPDWAQFVNHINPVAYFIKIMRMVMLKGSDFSNIINPFLAICFYAILSISMSVLRYKKTS